MNDSPTFELIENQQLEIEKLAGGKIAILSSQVVGSTVSVEFVTCKAPFGACEMHDIKSDAAFPNCNVSYLTCVDHIAAGTVTFDFDINDIPLKK